MLAARKLPVESAPAQEIGADSPDVITVAASRAPEVRMARLFEGELDQSVRELVAALKMDGVL